MKMTEKFYRPTLSNKHGYTEIVPQTRCCSQLSVRNGGVWDGLELHKLGTKAFNSIEAAKYQSEQMRKKKIASLQMQIAKLEAMNFS